MNKTRRKAIQDVIARLETLRDEVESLLNEEQDYYDNMPEAFQNGDKGLAASDAISYRRAPAATLTTRLKN